MHRYLYTLIIIAAVLIPLLVTACNGVEAPNATTPGMNPRLSDGSIIVDERLVAFPEDIIKVNQEMDENPPQLLLENWYHPIRLMGEVNTTAMEDIPFINPDGTRLYFHFSPPFNDEESDCLKESLTGTWVSERNDDGTFKLPFKIMHPDYRDTGNILESLDTFPWLYSIDKEEADYYGMDYEEPAIINPGNIRKSLTRHENCGGLDIGRDGKSVYFHALSGNGSNDSDIWIMRMVNGQWQEPENPVNINTEDDEGYPFMTFDGRELWFTRDYEGKPAIFRSVLIGQEWQQPVPVITGYASAPSLDKDRNIFFTHYQVVDGEITDADIYVAYFQKSCG
jgi:hypothetical protein